MSTDQPTHIEPHLAAKALNATVIRLGFVSFFADVASEMLYPITPIFLTLVLGTSVAHLGMIEGIAEGIASLVKTFAGSWSDRIKKRKTFIWLGYLFAAVAKPITGGATSWLHVLFARSFDRFGKGIRAAPRDALLAEAVPASLRGEAFGWHRLMDTMGAAVGPLLALVYLHFRSQPSDLRLIYLLAFIPGLCSVLIALSVKEPRSPAKVSTSTAASSKTRLPASPEFKKFLLGWGIFSLANSSDVFLLLQAAKTGASLQSTILLYAFYNLLYALTSPYLGHLSDKFGRKRILISGLVVYISVYLGFGFVTDFWQLWFLFGFYGLYMAATDGVGKAWAVDLVPGELKATGIGMLGTVSGITTAIASTVAGVLWDHLDSQATFIYGATGAMLAAVVFLTVSPTRRKLYSDDSA